MIRTNGNRFSVYTSEEKTVLGVINELAQENNQVAKEIDEINKVLEEKTDVHGDHKGTWQGLNKPTMSEEGIRSTVEDIIDNKIPSFQTALDNKASKEDVAKISSGTPLFANSTSEMIDTTKNYVNTTDGYLYTYQVGEWVKTIQYQATGIGDNTVDINHLKNKDIICNINSNNLFYNPTFQTDDGWLLVNKDGHTISHYFLKDSFSWGAYVPKTISGTNIAQRVPINKFTNAEYIVRCKKKTVVGTDFNGRLLIHLSDKSGKTLFEYYNSGSMKSDTLEYIFELDKNGFMSKYPSLEYITFSFTHNTTTSDCIFYEPFLGLTSRNTSYNNFKYVEIEERIKDTLQSTQNTLPLSGKKATFNGDSICEGVVNGGGYAKILAENEKLIVENKGISGGTIAKGTYINDNPSTPRHWISETVDSMSNDVDFAIFEGGRNDYGVNVPLGTLTTGYTGSIDNTTFYGALEHLFRQALIRFEGKKIGFIIIHKANAEPYTRNKQGLTMDDYYNAIIKTCEKYSIPVCDLYKNSGLITALNDLKVKYTQNSDGLHPNDEGYKKYYVPKISSWLKTL